MFRAKTQSYQLRRNTHFFSNLSGMRREICSIMPGKEGLFFKKEKKKLTLDVWLHSQQPDKQKKQFQSHWCFLSWQLAAQQGMEETGTRTETSLCCLFRPFKHYWHRLWMTTDYYLAMSIKMSTIFDKRESDREKKFFSIRYCPMLNAWHWNTPNGCFNIYRSPRQLSWESSSSGLISKMVFVKVHAHVNIIKPSVMMELFIVSNNLHIPSLSGRGFPWRIRRV